MLKVCSIQQMIEAAKNVDQIVCYGAGQRLKMMEDFFGNTVVWNKLTYIVDRDLNKQHSQIYIKDKALSIISLDELKQQQCGKFIIIITCIRYEEIVEQLNGDDILGTIDYYCLFHMHKLALEEAALGKDLPTNIRLSDVAMIPKVIHYCWFGNKEFPDKYRKWMESWKKFCPDYEIVEWNESNYDIKKNMYMYQAYQNQKWGFVSDYARLDIIYNYGGIYLDTDVELVQNLDDLLYQEGFSGFESYDAVNFGLGVGAVQHMPIIKEIMKMYENLPFLKKDGSMNLVPCPLLQTKVLEKHGLKKNGEYQIIDGMTIYPEKMLCGKSRHTRRVIMKPYTRAIHHFEGSWIGEDAKIRNSRIEREMMLFQ